MGMMTKQNGDQCFKELGKKVETKMLNLAPIFVICLCEMGSLRPYRKAKGCELSICEEKLILKSLKFEILFFFLPIFSKHIALHTVIIVLNLWFNSIQLSKGELAKSTTLNEPA